MKRMPIDVTAVGFIAAGAPEAVTEFDSGRPKTDASGTPLFAVSVLAMFDGAAEVISIKVPGEPKGITAGAPVRPVVLVGVPYEIDGRSGVAFRAARIEAGRPEARSGSGS